jgi:hypothetical protein
MVHSGRHINHIAIHLFQRSNTDAMMDINVVRFVRASATRSQQKKVAEHNTPRKRKRTVLDAATEIVDIVGQGHVMSCWRLKRIIRNTEQMCCNVRRVVTTCAQSVHTRFVLLVTSG